jgi:hypothetical protein
MYNMYNNNNNIAWKINIKAILLILIMNIIIDKIIIFIIFIVLLIYYNINNIHCIINII